MMRQARSDMAALRGLSILSSFTAAAALSPAIAPDLATLSSRAGALSSSWAIEFGSGYAFDSEYTKGGKARGWSNWLVSSKLMLGQYPGVQPAVPGPSAEDAQAHLKRVLNAGVDCFVQLQDELPPQDEPEAWPADGVQLADSDARAKWPAPFVRYAPEADRISGEMGAAAPLRYLHCPVVDLSVPKDDEALRSLLGEMLTHFEEGGEAIYMHCWGGRGRAGLVGACMLALLCPELESTAVLAAVQTAYDSRVGASGMPGSLKRSPQTEGQRRFVSAFISALKAARRYENDVGMMNAGMPKGFL